MQCLLPPCRIKNKTSTKGNKFYNNQESRRAFFTFAQTNELYMEQLENKVKSDGAVPPFITVIGDIYSPQSFCCDFENVRYKVFSITKAIDICFRAFHVFHIKYPDACIHVWNFLNMQFYEIPSKYASSVTSMLLKSIQGNNCKKNNKKKCYLKLFPPFQKQQYITTLN